MKNLSEIMKQVQSMQSRMSDVQSKLDQMTVVGQAAGGMVSISMTGKSVIKDVAIDASLIKVEDKEILEDLLVTAFNDARAKTEALMADEMKTVTGGLPLPPGFKLPF